MYRGCFKNEYERQLLLTFSFGDKVLVVVYIAIRRLPLLVSDRAFTLQVEGGGKNLEVDRWGRTGSDR